MTFIERSTYLRQVRLFSRNARLFLLSQLIAAVGSGIYSLLFNLYLVRSGFNEDFIGQVSGVNTLVAGLVCFPAGLIGDRLGRRASLLLGGIIVPLGLLGQVLVHEPQLILGLCALTGAGQAFIMISVSPFMAENSSRAERTYLFSTNWAVMTFSGMVGSFLGGLLPGLFASSGGQTLDAASPYGMALLVAVCLFAIAGIPFYLLRSAPHQDESIGAAAPDISMGKDEVRSRMLAFVAVNILVGIAGGVILPFFNVFFARQFGLAAGTVGLIFAASQGMVGIGQLLAPTLVRRKDKVTLIALAHFSAVPFLLILASTGQVGIAAGAFWARNVGMNMINPIWGTFTMEMVPARLRATLSGLNNMVWNVTWAFSSAAGGLVILSWGYPAVFLISAFFYAVTGFTWLFVFRRYRKM